MCFFGQLVWSFALVIATSPLCYVIHQCLSEGLLRDGVSQEIHDYWLDNERDINLLEA